MEVVFITHDGKRFVVQVNRQTPTSLMRVAVDNSVPGIVAECGGSCACATCHVYVDPQWAKKLRPPAELESAMLEAVSERRANSRLSCQIEIEEALDGLTVELPESQY